MQSTVSVAKAFVLSPLLGSKSSRATKKVNSPVSCNATKKVNSYDEDWKKGFFGTGLFLEDSEVSSKSAFKKIEEKKLLSTVEKAGLLSTLDKAGFTLSGIEKAGLLSTAENLGLLALAEDVLTGNPATLASNALPFIVLSVLSASLIPHDNAVETFLSYGLSLTFVGVAAGFLVGGFVVASIQED
jgi:hypothetical protein|eukprot:CAMPEP_0182606930 /NCGR_PEP_ID=MMETSP1330-20130603/1711_1 /TAXON_ID=464278 /ORGANISM="Picochlorum sp., Strain RCC944" /LENGTH=185 /DNA_ID=CAMNT_0024825407 /DNA_START=64 /DNA_END=621 /DNA_ORIENTATION=+